MTLCIHRSTLVPGLVWTVEQREGYGWKKQFAVRCYHRENQISETEHHTETASREQFEKRVEAHYGG